MNAGAPPLTTLGAWARSYRERGFSVFPVGRDKRPLLQWKPYQKTYPTVEQVDEWWRNHPDANIGVATGAVSGLVVLDADGPEGLTSLRALGTLATTPLSQTGRPEGFHQFFRHPGPGIIIANRAGLRPHLDVRGDGGYVILPPSLHASGIRYQWLTPPDRVPLAPLPAELLNLLGGLPSVNGPDSPRAGEIREGERNDRLYRTARSLFAQGRSADEVWDALREENQARCTPPLSEAEVQDIVEHASQQPHRSDFRGRGVKARPVPCLIDLTTVTPRPVEWLWPGRLAKGKLTELVGEPNLGKTLISTDIAARLSIGGLWPDGSPAPKGRTILMTSEDGIDDTIVPRLIAAGADLAMVRVLRMARHADGDRPVTLDKVGLDTLEQAVREFDAALLIIDPLSAYLGSTDTHRDAAVRGILTPFADLLDRTGVACLGLLHPPKQVTNVVYFASGSGAFTAQARVVLAVAKDDADDTEARRLLLKIKGNLFGDVPTLAYRVVVRDGQTAALEWEPDPVEGVTARDVLGLREEREERSARKRAREFLREFLGDGAKYVQDVSAHAAANGIAMKTLRRAKDDLGVIAYKTRQPGTPRQAWAWQLPEQPQDGQ